MTLTTYELLREGASFRLLHIWHEGVCPPETRCVVAALIFRKSDNQREKWPVLPNEVVIETDAEGNLQ